MGQLDIGKIELKFAEWLLENFGPGSNAKTIYIYIVTSIYLSVLLMTKKTICRGNMFQFGVCVCVHPAWNYGPKVMDQIINDKIDLTWMSFLLYFVLKLSDQDTGMIIKKIKLKSLSISVPINQTEDISPVQSLFLYATSWPVLNRIVKGIFFGQ